MVGVDYVHFIQKNSLDRRKRTLVIVAHNETFSSRLIINEQCMYSVSKYCNSETIALTQIITSIK